MNIPANNFWIFSFKLGVKFALRLYVAVIAGAVRGVIEEHERFRAEMAAFEATQLKTHTRSGAG